MGIQTRRTFLRQSIQSLSAVSAAALVSRSAQAKEVLVPSVQPRPWIEIRGIYGGFPDALLENGKTPADFGVNAIWVGSGGLKEEKIQQYHEMGLKVFAEFNSMHHASYLKEHPEAAPIGSDGKPCPPPHGWQGVSPFHEGYRKNRMAEFERILQTYAIDGIWLDYHHSHASWERAEPAMPDTDFSPAALAGFKDATGIKLSENVSEAAKLLLNEHKAEWTQFRCDVFTDWVREYRTILNRVKPKALLGTFHCPWSDDDYDGAIRHKLAIDLPAQAEYVDVFSIMPYHARFGHPDDPAWIARQTKQLGQLLKLNADSKQKIWPIVQLADWGEEVHPEQVAQVLDAGTQSPATGVMVFHWSGLSKQWSKVEKMSEFYCSIHDD